MSFQLPRSSFYLLGAACLCATITGCARPSPTPAPGPTPIQIVFAGESDLASLGQELANAYQLKTPSVLVEWVGGNTTFAVDQFHRGGAQLALLSRQPPVDQLGSYARANKLGREAIAVIVNPQNSLSEISHDKLAQVFAGEINEWPQLAAKLPAGAPTAISVLVRETGSGLRQDLQSMMGSRRLTLAALVQPSEADVLETVATRPNAIGYIAAGSVTPRVRALIIDSSAPTLNNVVGGAYSLVRTAYLLRPIRPEPAVAGFLDFIESSAGLAILRKHLAYQGLAHAPPML